MNQKWDSTLYDNNHSFVSEYGKNLIDLLQPKGFERILDLGCGTGDLTSEISKLCSEVIGVDASRDMIRKAKSKYPELKFETMDATNLQFADEFNAVFSNAVLHWIKTPEKALKSIYTSLKDRGRFIAEFGGRNNCRQIVSTLIEVINETEYKFNSLDFPWFFPSIGEYSNLMENAGFEVQYAYYFDRPTKLEGGSSGLNSWIAMFGEKFFSNVPISMLDNIVGEVEIRLEDKLKNDGVWYADYKRIRVVGLKK